MPTDQQKRAAQELVETAKAHVERDAAAFNEAQRQLQAAKDQLAESQALLEKMEDAERRILRLRTIH